MSKQNNTKCQPGNIEILPRNFQELLSFFYESKFETEVRFGRFRVDFYAAQLQLAFEYDGVQHYSVIQKIESDKRKEELLANQGIRLIRWPYYFMPTKDTCEHIFGEAYSAQKFSLMLKTMFGANKESQICAPGFHSTTNIPANFIWPGIDRFLKELADCPPSIVHQVRHSLKLYCQAKAPDHHDIVIPTYHDEFMDFFNGVDDPSYLNLVFKNDFQGALNKKQNA